MTETQNDGYQILVVNIKYGKDISTKVKEKPEIAVLDVPDGILKHKNNDSMFMDSIESFAYNTITKKYGSEVTYCQVYLPF